MEEEKFWKAPKLANVATHDEKIMETVSFNSKPIPQDNDALAETLSWPSTHNRRIMYA